MKISIATAIYREWLLHNCYWCVSFKKIHLCWFQSNPTKSGTTIVNKYWALKNNITYEHAETITVTFKMFHERLSHKYLDNIWKLLSFLFVWMFLFTSKVYITKKNRLYTAWLGHLSPSFHWAWRKANSVLSTA